MKNTNNAVDIATAATQRTDRKVQFSLYQRVIVGNLLGAQTAATLRKILGRDASDEEQAALYCIRGKVMVRPNAAEMARFTQRFGGEQRIDQMALMQLPAEENGVRPTLDGMEVRLLREFLSGWLKVDGSLADRDWLDGLVEQCR